LNALDSLQQATQILALLVGGAWAYFNFVKRRTLVRRAEIRLSASLMRFQGTTFIHATVSAENTGLSVLPLSLQFIVIHSLHDSKWELKPRVELEWGDELVLMPVLQEHEWIEGGEQVHDEVLIPLPASLDDQPLAYQATAMLVSKRRRRVRLPTRLSPGAAANVEDVVFTARTILTAAIQPQNLQRTRI
jgi:hypothetical protein